MIYLIATLGLVLALNSTVVAETGTVTDLGGGISTFNDSSGRSGTIIDLGGGIKSYHDNRGGTGTIVEVAPGIQHFNSTTPGLSIPTLPSSPPVTVTPPGLQRPQPGNPRGSSR
jgi:hypothetical protein